MVKKILMICLGNICRSPIAEVVMVQALENAKLDNVVVDSAAIGSWHVGNRADHRALSTLESHGLKSTHIVRQIKKNDFEDFDYIFGMDEDNMSELRRLAPKNSKAELLMLGDFGLEKKNRIIEDPYYERGAAGFETAYQQCVVACAAFVKERLQNNLRNQQFTMKILFVCLGNTCRSPMAESVMEQLIRKHQLQDWHTDSAGLRDWNVGREPQGRAQHLLQQHGLNSRHLSRLITNQDFYDFDYILGMDNENIKELQQKAHSLQPQPDCKILLLGSYLGRKEDEIIPDPYFSQGMGGFHSAYLQINESCEAFVKKHKKDNNGF